MIKLSMVEGHSAHSDEFNSFNLFSTPIKYQVLLTKGIEISNILLFELLVIRVENMSFHASYTLLKT